MSSPPPRLDSPAALRERFIRRVSADSPFYRLFDHLPDLAFFAKDSDFRFMCASRRFMDRFGITEEAGIVGKNDFDLFPARLAENFRRDDEEVLRTGKAQLNIVELFFTDQGRRRNDQVKLGQRRPSGGREDRLSLWKHDRVCRARGA